MCQAGFAFTELVEISMFESWSGCKFKKWTLFMKTKFLIVLLAVICPVVKAATTTPAEIPANLHVYSGSTIYVDLVAHDCSGRRYYIKNDHVRYDSIVSILLAAQLSQRKVQLRISGCNAKNQGEIIGVYLK